MSPNSVNSLSTPSISNQPLFSIIHFNSTSLVKHIKDVRAKFNYFSAFDVIAISETWLKPYVTDAMMSLPGYRIIRCDRLDRVGGGVAFYIKEHFTTKPLYSTGGAPHGSSAEMLVHEIQLGGPNSSPLLFALLYRPPSCEFHRGIEFLGVH